MLAVPPAILDMLKLQAGATVGLAVDDGRLVVDPRVRPSYTMDELLALCEAGADDQTDREWLNVVPLGREL
jgi:antitoxin ChpS